MKTLIAYYSRDGHTHEVASAIADHIGADIYRIKERADRKGILGYLKAGKDAMTGKQADLINPLTDVKVYKRIIFCSPVWGWKPVPAVMTYIGLLDLQDKEAGTVVTMGGSCGKSLLIMDEAVKKQGGTPVSTTSIVTSGVTKNQYLAHAKRFAEDLLKKQ